jgi:hypothetical protein
MPIKDKYRMKPAPLQKSLAEDVLTSRKKFAKLNSEVGPSTWVKPPETKIRKTESTPDGPKRKSSFRYKSSMAVVDYNKHIVSSPRTIIEPVTPNGKQLKRTESRQDQKWFGLSGDNTIKERNETGSSSSDALGSYEHSRSNRSSSVTSGGNDIDREQILGPINDELKYCNFNND